jgi:uncharacterized membrane protein YgdD (TMEM256/DUF423 family)
MQDQTDSPTKALFYLYGLFWLFAGLAGASSVFLDAWLSHGFTSNQAGVLESLQTAVGYQQFNSLTLAFSLWIAGAGLRQKNKTMGWLSLLPSLFFLLAIFAFSGGIYGKHLLDLSTGAITPTGGFMMALGWLSLAHVGWRYQREERKKDRESKTSLS